MEKLWQKETESSDGLHVDLFKVIREISPDEITKWDEYLQLLKTKHSDNVSKNNTKSSNLMERAGQNFQENNFDQAMDVYTRALSFAELKSDNISMAFANRADCFFQLKMYDRTLKDVELALASNCTEEIKAKLEELQKNSHELMKSGASEPIEEKQYFTSNESVPCLSEMLTVTSNEQFGRHLVANCDINVGQLVLMEESFASVAKCNDQMTCYTCLTEIANFIPCLQCTDVVFCSEKCMDANLVHKFDCNTVYHVLHFKAKFTIQTILIAVTAFSNIEDLMVFVEDSESKDTLPHSINDLQSEYHLYLKHKKPSLNNDVELDVYKLYSCIMLIPSIEKMFDSERKQRFLMHLVLHHLAINVLNASESEVSASIGNVFSLFNHACAPSIYNYSVNNQKIGITIRPVKKGEQLFISYLGLDTEQPVEQRQQSLRMKWDFECKCDKCEPRYNAPDSSKLKMDPNYKFIHRYFKSPSKNHPVDVVNASMLKKKCVKFLTKYGHLPFSNEVKFISDLYTKLI